MKLATYQSSGGQIRIGIVHAAETRVFDLAAAAERAGTEGAAFRSMLALMEAGDRGLDAARGLFDTRGGDTSLSAALSEVRLLSPVPVPGSIRDFVAFEGHMLGAPAALMALKAELAGEPVPEPPANPQIAPFFLHHPNFYKGNRYSVIGTDTGFRRPRGCTHLDYELEFGIYIGKGGEDISKARARDHIFGYTVFNDFSARDFQMSEVGNITGPAKSKDFSGGYAIGPWIVTADEVPDAYALRMLSRVNGELWCDGATDGMIYSFEDMIAYASQDERLHPGEFFGSGTVGLGTGMELGRYLQDGDVIELEVEGLGVLRNHVLPAKEESQ
ncbi:fumarylacetoacetate hydrolase family protein [Salipiger sp. P9]|uniref:fumarylacetoacetate hydrolase family protein n=1 Tax=Salipiger pentaromativorans TaxID=2943193 RepID=UPI0021571BC9|nr:fumarylacetoacetate hydrolase family protein [Salipiger pentaromativorans]MCR8547568.1 fumarylacetoacetate hydrolase family protein [Salipiger pentaromativorans]